MRLLSLSVSNWACHRSLDVDLSSGLQIEGRNGTGKSSILKAIRFAFAETATGYKSRITNGERSAEIKLSFLRDGRTYVIEKRLHVDRSSEAQLLCDGTLVADNPSSVSEALREFISEEVLDNLLYVPQGEVTGIVDRLAQKGGRQELDALFGLDRLEAVYKACGERIKDAKARTDVLTEQLAKYPEDAEREYSGQINRLIEEMQNLDSEKKVFSAKRNELSSQLKSVEEEIKDLKSKREEKENLKDQIKNIELSLAEQKNHVNSLKRELDGLGEKRGELSSLRTRADFLKRFTEVRNILVKYTTLVEQLNSISSLPEEKRVKELEGVIADKEMVTKMLSLREKELKGFEQILLEAEVELAKRREYLEGLSALPGAVKCPRCGQFLDKGHLKQEIQFTKRDMSKFEARIKEVKKKEPSLRKNVEELKKDLEDIKEGEFEVRSLKEIVSKKLSDSERLVKEASELEMKLEALAYEGEDLSVVDDFVAEYNALKGKADLLEKELSREEKIKREIAENEGDYFKGSNLKEELSARFNGIIFDRVMLDEAEKNRGHLLDKKYSVEGMIREAEFKVSENLMGQKEISEKRETFMELKKGRDETEGKLNILSRAREVFHTDRGLPKYLRDKYIHALGALLTQYFKRFNQNPAYKEIFFDKDYKIQVKATSGLLSLEQLSGGERVQLAVALRISLIEMLSPIRLLILDEPFGSLDAEHRELLGETLNKMAAGWQLILVTHVHVDSLQLESIQLEGY